MALASSKFCTRTKRAATKVEEEFKTLFFWTAFLATDPSFFVVSLSLAYFLFLEKLWRDTVVIILK